MTSSCDLFPHYDVIKWKHFPRNWPFVRGIHRSPVNSPHKGQWRGALMFTLICARINGWVNTREAGDLRRYRPHYDFIVMSRNGELHRSWLINMAVGWYGCFYFFSLFTRYLCTDHHAVIRVNIHGGLNWHRPRVRHHFLTLSWKELFV